MEDYNKVLGKNEEEKQFILQILSEDRKSFYLLQSTLCQQICKYNNNLYFGLTTMKYGLDL